MLKAACMQNTMQEFYIVTTTLWFTHMLHKNVYAFWLSHYNSITYNIQTKPGEHLFLNYDSCFHVIYMYFGFVN